VQICSGRYDFNLKAITRSMNILYACVYAIDGLRNGMVLLCCFFILQEFRTVEKQRCLTLGC